MGVYIKGMEMPDCCTRCDYLGLNVAIGCTVMTGTNGRATDCPLIKVPPHGRLIDEQWLNMQIHTAKEIHANEKRDFCNAFDSNGRVCTEWWCVEEMIDGAPPIIPAEEGDK